MSLLDLKAGRTRQRIGYYAIVGLIAFALILLILAVLNLLAYLG